MLYKCQNPFGKGCLLLLSVFIVLSWKAEDADPIQSAKECLFHCFDPGAQNIKLKKWDLDITDKGFFRLRKYFPNGKQEYFSFHLNRFVSMDYIGTTESGTLSITTLGDDIIVQTYNDPQGNIDSMSRVIQIPLKQIEAEQLNILQANLLSLKKK